MQQQCHHPPPPLYNYTYKDRKARAHGIASTPRTALQQTIILEFLASSAGRACANVIARHLSFDIYNFYAQRTRPSLREHITFYTIYIKDEPARIFRMLKFCQIHFRVNNIFNSMFGRRRHRRIGHSFIHDICTYVQRHWQSISNTFFKYKF